MKNSFLPLPKTLNANKKERSIFLSRNKETGIVYRMILECSSNNIFYVNRSVDDTLSSATGSNIVTSNLFSEDIPLEVSDNEIVFNPVIGKNYFRIPFDPIEPIISERMNGGGSSWSFAYSCQCDKTGNDGSIKCKLWYQKCDGVQSCGCDLAGCKDCVLSASKSNTQRLGFPVSGALILIAENVIGK